MAASSAGVRSSTRGITFRGTLGQCHVLGPRVVSGSEVPPRQRSLLTIGLAERDRKARAGQLLAEIERMRRFIDAELRKDFLDIRAAHESVIVQNGDAAGIRKDAEVRIRDLRLERPQFFL